MSGRVELRGHHLLCLHFFRGEGYDERFVDNLWSVLESLGDSVIAVVDGPDAVCSACPSLSEGVCVSEDGGETEIRRLDDIANRLLGTSPGDVIVWAGVRERLRDALPDWRDGACSDCRWQSVCLPLIELELR